MNEIIQLNSALGSMPAAQGERNGPGSRGKALLAGLPHLLFALAMYLPVLTWGVLPIPDLSQIARHAFWALAGAVIILSAWRGRERFWQRWMASWIGYGMVGLLDLVSRLFFSPQNIAAAQAIFLVWLALVLGAVFWQAKRDLLSGLLTVFSIMPMYFFSLAVDGIQGLIPEILLLIIGLLASMIVASIVRRGSWQSGAWLVLATLFVTSLPVAYATTFFSSLPPGYAPAPTFLQMIDIFLRSILLFAILSAPVWLVAFWRRGGRRKMASGE